MLAILQPNEICGTKCWWFFNRMKILYMDIYRYLPGFCYLLYLKLIHRYMRAMPTMQTNKLYIYHIGPRTPNSNNTIYITISNILAIWPISLSLTCSNFYWLFLPALLQNFTHCYHVIRLIMYYSHIILYGLLFQVLTSRKTWSWYIFCYSYIV